MKLGAISLFAGCGGSDLGLRSAGVESHWANDINQVACELYQEVVGRNVIEHRDVKTIDRFPKADLLVGCYPCQGYSQGGRRKVRDGINFLYREFDRALRQIRPLAFIAENVDGMRFDKNAVLLRNQLHRFRSAGYSVGWRVLNAQHYGLAQYRRRLFIVGIRSSESLTFRFPTPTHGDETERQECPHLAPLRTLRDVIWKYRKAPEGSFDPDPFHWYYLSRNRRREWHQQAPCIVANWRHLGLHPDSPPLVKVEADKWKFAHPGFARRFSYLEAAALQGFSTPEAFRSGTPDERARAIGNAVPPPLFGAVAKALVRQLQRQD